MRIEFKFAKNSNKNEILKVSFTHEEYFGGVFFVRYALWLSLRYYSGLVCRSANYHKKGIIAGEKPRLVSVFEVNPLHLETETGSAEGTFQSI